MNRIFVTTTALLMVTLLSACGGSATQAPLEPAATTEAAPQPTALPAATDTAAPTVDATETKSATEAPATEAATDAVSYVNDVKPILDAKCIKCHGVETKKEGLDMLSYDSLIAGSRQGPVLVPGNATDSLMVQLIVEGEMPNRGPKVTPEELQIIIDWVNQGAVNN